MNLILRVYENIQRSKRGKIIETEPFLLLPRKLPNWLIYSICLLGPALLVDMGFGLPNLIVHLRGETVYPIVAFDWWWLWIL